MAWVPLASAVLDTVELLRDSYNPTELCLQTETTITFEQNPNVFSLNLQAVAKIWDHPCLLQPKSAATFATQRVSESFPTSQWYWTQPSLVSGWAVAKYCLSRAAADWLIRKPTRRGSPRLERTKWNLSPEISIFTRSKVSNGAKTEWMQIMLINVVLLLAAGVKPCSSTTSLIIDFWSPPVYWPY